MFRNKSLDELDILNILLPGAILKNNVVHIDLQCGDRHSRKWFLSPVFFDEKVIFFQKSKMLRKLKVFGKMPGGGMKVLFYWEDWIH
jgi:hypothetical protein